MTRTQGFLTRPARRAFSAGNREKAHGRAGQGYAGREQAEGTHFQEAAFRHRHHGADGAHVAPERLLLKGCQLPLFGREIRFFRREHSV